MHLEGDLLERPSKGCYLRMELRRIGKQMYADTPVMHLRDSELASIIYISSSRYLAEDHLQGEVPPALTHASTAFDWQLCLSDGTTIESFGSSAFQYIHWKVSSLPFLVKLFDERDVIF